MQQAQQVINKSDLITNLASACDGIEETVVDEAVREIIGLMVDSLSHDGRVEVRGFGSFVCTIAMHAMPEIQEQVKRWQ